MTRALQTKPVEGTLIMEDYNRIQTRAVGSGITGFVVFGLVVVASFVGGAGYWATSSELDGAVVAPGNFVVEGNRKTVEHLDGGIVREIRVADGDLVQAGQTLVELDSTDLDVDLDVIESQIADLTARRARLMAQIEGAGSFTSEYLENDQMSGDPWQEAFETQRLLFEAELQTRRAEETLLDQQIENLRDQVDGFQSQRASNTRQLEITREELGNLETLLAKGLVAIVRVNSRRVEIERLNGVDASLATEEAQARNRINELQLASVRTRTERTEAASAELALVEGRLATLRPQFVGATERLKRIVVTAPVDGRVVGLSVFTAGGVLRPGEPILDIVPQHQPLLVEARIDPTDIEKLSIGQSSRVRLSAFDQGDAPEAMGRIVDISADSIEDQRTGQFFYTAKVELDADQPAEVAALELIPGMPVDLFVNTGERTALSYLAQPLRDRLVRTFIE